MSMGTDLERDDVYCSSFDEEEVLAVRRVAEDPPPSAVDEEDFVGSRAVRSS